MVAVFDNVLNCIFYQGRAANIAGTRRSGVTVVEFATSSIASAESHRAPFATVLVITGPPMRIDVHRRQSGAKRRGVFWIFPPTLARHVLPFPVFHHVSLQGYTRNKLYVIHQLLECMPRRVQLLT